MNEDKVTVSQEFWEFAKIERRGNWVTEYLYEERREVSNQFPKIHHGTLPKWKHPEAQVSRRNKIINIRADVNKIENRKAAELINKKLILYKDGETWQTFSCKKVSSY